MRPLFKSILSVTIALGIILGLFWLGVFQPVELFFARIVTPISKLIYDTSIYVHPGYKANSINELVEDYISLEKQYTALQAEEAVTTDIARENENLRKQLSFLRDRTFTSIGADVVGRQIDPAEKTIFINVGSEQGIARGMPVITAEGVMVGTVQEVELVYSIVQLLTDSKSALAATINSEDRSIGIVNGGFGISLEMNLIPQNERIVPGDSVITSGLTKGVPRGLFIGTVDSIEREAYEPFQRAIINPPEQLDKVTTVSVIIE